jgi:hypothetical protein
MSGTDQERVFVQIASYRDAELPRTIESALATAQQPGRVTFGICWQYDELTITDLDPWLNDPQVRISPHYYEDSKGCCWARNQTNLLYDGEAYTLQIDAHTRFADNWDARFISMLRGLDSEKPLLSTYPAPFEYVDGKPELYLNHGMQRLILNRMHRDLTTIFKAEVVEDRSTPAKSRFLGAGQIFTQGRFCREVEYDPELYYSGEEISMSARAYTHGYDFFCPNEDLIWHLYQHSMPVHWSDHRDTQHDNALERLHNLFIGDHRTLGRHGLGPHRTLQEFEAYAGISFQERLDRKPVKTHYRRSIDLDLSRIPDREDYDFWIFTLRSVEDEELYRRDLDEPEILQKKISLLEIDEHLDDEPVTYMLWPHTPEDGYLRQYFHDTPP